MIAQHKKGLLALFISLFAFAANAQEKGDLGFMVSSANQTRLALEYRKPVADKLHFKLGATYGNSSHPSFFYSNSEIISASDSVIEERSRNSYTNYAGLRIGVERQMSNSIFSFGGDFNLNYRNSYSSYYSRTRILDEGGVWIYDYPISPYPFEDLETTRITRHYFEPSFRLSFNMNIPLSTSFVLSLTGSTSVGVPIYMGATNVHDPYGDFLGTPPTIINLYQGASIGLRYNIGGIKKEKAEKLKNSTAE